MELNHKTPKLIPGSWYVSFTSDDMMLPVYVQPINVEPDTQGVWRATFRDTKMGEFEVREGEKRFAFYARVKMPLVDRTKPETFDKGELFELAEKRLAYKDQMKALEAEMRTLDIARATSGGSR